MPLYHPLEPLLDSKTSSTSGSEHWVRFHMHTEATHPRDDWSAADKKDSRLPFVDTRAEYMHECSPRRRACGQVLRGKTLRDLLDPLTPPHSVVGASFAPMMDGGGAETDSFRLLKLRRGSSIRKQSELGTLSRSLRYPTTKIQLPPLQGNSSGTLPLPALVGVGLPYNQPVPPLHHSEILHTHLPGAWQLQDSENEEMEITAAYDKTRRVRRYTSSHITTTTARASQDPQWQRKRRSLPAMHDDHLVTSVSLSMASGSHRRSLVHTRRTPPPPSEPFSIAPGPLWSSHDRLLLVQESQLRSTQAY